MNFDQGELSFDGHEDGYQKWQQDLDERKRAFERRYGVILGKHVQVRLHNVEPVLVGIVRLVSNRTPANSKQLRFAIGAREFVAAEIESIVALKQD